MRLVQICAARSRCGVSNINNVATNKKEAEEDVCCPCEVSTQRAEFATREFVGHLVR